MSDVNDFTLEKIVTFLKDYSWIYNFKVTNLLSDNIVDQIPLLWREFLSTLDINKFNEIFIYQNYDKNSVPNKIINFLSQYNSILLSFPVRELVVSDICNEDKRGVSHKKVHEISNLSEFIETKVSSSSTSDIKIVDIGAGLGYLGEQLSRRGFSVIGVETSRGHVERAETRRQKTGAHTFDTLQLNIDDTSADNLLRCVTPGQDICLVSSQFHICFQQYKAEILTHL